MDAWVLDKPRETGPALQHAAHRFAEITPWKAHLFGGPAPDAMEGPLRPLGPQVLPQRVGGGVAGEGPWHQALNRVELPNQPADLGARRRPRRGDLVVLPFRVRPAMHEGEAGAIARENLSYTAKPSTTTMPA
jgi:hypothetical protein